MTAPPEIEVRVPRVFCGPGGTFGNPLGIVLDGLSVPVGDRQALARHLGYSETVFVDDARAGRIAIYTPEVELPFAGHPSVGTAWMLHGEGHDVDVLRPPAGEVPVRRDGAIDLGGGAAGVVPRLGDHRVRLARRGRRAAGRSRRLPLRWAWIDEDAGIVRARSFVAEAGIGEDEATGSAALPLCASLGRAIEVRQGRGSVIHARPIGDGFVEIGGRVVEDR